MAVGMLCVLCTHLDVDVFVWLMIRLANSQQPTAKAPIIIMNGIALLRVILIWKSNQMSCTQLPSALNMCNIRCHFRWENVMKTIKKKGKVNRNHTLHYTLDTLKHWSMAKALTHMRFPWDEWVLILYVENFVCHVNWW